MGRKGGVWGFLRSLGGRASSTDDSLAGFVTIELRPEPVETWRNRESFSQGGAADSQPPDAGPAGSPETALTDAVTYCVDTYIRPVLVKLSADDSLIQHPTSRVVLAALAGYWLLAVCSSLILLMAALAAPALRSVRALESGDAERRRRWLRYWSVYAAVATVSIVSDPLQGLIPGYWTAKTLLLLWCAAPFPWHGSDFVFYHLLVPAWRHLTEMLPDYTETTEPVAFSQ